MELRKLLRKFTKQQLLDSVFQVLNLKSLRKQNIQRSTKEEIISNVIKTIKDSDIDVKELVLALELKCCQVQANRKQWCAVEIKNPKIFIKQTTAPEKFARKLSKYLNRSQFFCEVACEFLNNVMWTAISAKNLKSQSKIFLLTYVDLPIFLHSHAVTNQRDIICRSLVEVFNGTGCEKYPMKSKNIDTLLLCVSQKLTTVDNVEEKLPVERKKRPEIEKAVALPNNIINEDSCEELERKLYLEEIFGDYEQPVLDNLTYNSISSFCGFKDLKEKPIENVATRVVFKGENILEGLKELAERNAMDVPFPDYMSNILSYGTDRCTIKCSAIEN